jgi:hypothetical protein
MVELKVPLFQRRSPRISDPRRVKGDKWKYMRIRMVVGEDMCRASVGTYKQGVHWKVYWS